MSSNRLFIASRERHSGSLSITVGVMAWLRRHYGRVAFFKPIVLTPKPPDCRLIKDFFQLNMLDEAMFGVTIDEATQLISQNKKHTLYEKLLQKFQALTQDYDFVLVQGMTLTRHASTIDFDINSEISKHFNAPMISVLNGLNKTASEIEKEIEMEIQSSTHLHDTLFSIFINQITDSQALKMPKNQSNLIPIFRVPYLDELDTPTVKEVTEALQGQLLFEASQSINRLVKRPLIAAMTVENVLKRLQEGDMIIVPGDRTEILTAAIMSLYAKEIPNIAGIVLTGGLKPSPIILNLIEGFRPEEMPIILVETDTYPSAMKTHQVRAHLHASNENKIHLSLGLFDQQVDQACLFKKLGESHSDITTPIMFEYSLFERAKADLKRIVLPESDDPRILQACALLASRQVVHPILLGDAEKITQQSQLLGVDLTGVEIIHPETSPWRAEMIEALYQLRKHKGITREIAKDSIAHINYFATMMVQLGYADGMVSGATHTTADTVRPALQIIKTQANISLVSSVFFMCFDSRVLVYGDCAVNPEPNAQQLSEIALSAAQTAQQFGIDPKVALLSYSTGESGKGEEVEKVRQATRLAQATHPNYPIEGPIQYDAAIDETVAKQKMPNSQVAGQATVFIFPDLNTGNNTYKAVQRAADAIAIGPVLQGLNKPVNDLSRGCLVDDIVNTVAITAIQAQGIQS